MTTTDIEQLHKLMEDALPELEALIGWQPGYDALHAAPAIARTPEEASRLVFNPFCIHNLARTVAKTPPPPAKEGEAPKKIGVCVKGCDSRSIIALIQEGFLKREQLYIIGIPCKGTIDLRRLMKLAGEDLRAGVKSARIEGDSLVVEGAKGSRSFPLEKVLARRCMRCKYPNPVIYDVMAGDPVIPRASEEEAHKDVDAVENLPVAERLAFWQGELDRCIRCYACRNACPLCMCQDRCIAETRDPKWLPQYMGLSEKFIFHFIHAMHLAGRCTECGECERVCPQEIPVTLIKEKLNRITKELLDYEAGVSTEAVPPFLTFNPEELGI